MKIGLSYSRCIRDIVDGVVDIADVLVIITRTDFDPRDDKAWSSIWSGYAGGGSFGSAMANPEWFDYGPEMEQKFREVTLDLYNTGRMHQPRQFGAYPMRLPHIWLETILPSEVLDQNPSVKAAWEKFQTVAALSSINIDENHVA
jgi:hypothetical protein